ncbi:Uncharacterised protein [Citrobacter koseri]|uniref:Uncharacterized protein n=1 Tax=Citrobacter koseri TaxID=545 RepID=A0A2X2XIQ2_CITKO|nr:Uncharacterised protein [Citrobacter koseri]
MATKPAAADQQIQPAECSEEGLSASREARGAFALLFAIKRYPSQFVNFLVAINYRI